MIGGRAGDRERNRGGNGNTKLKEGEKERYDGCYGRRIGRKTSRTGGEHRAKIEEDGYNKIKW